MAIMPEATRCGYRRSSNRRAPLFGRVAGVMLAMLPLGAAADDRGADKPAPPVCHDVNPDAIAAMIRTAEGRKQANLARRARRDGGSAGAEGAAARRQDQEPPHPSPAPSGSEAGARGDPRFEDARRRYAEALGVEHPTEASDPRRPPGFARLPDSAVLELDQQALATLLKRQWRGVGRGADDPKRMIERTRVFVAIARAMGLRPEVGALQAGFGTPDENGLAELAQALDAARGALATHPAQPELAAAVHERERELGAAVAALPGGPKEGWTLFDLDVNADGRIDRKDLEHAREERRTRDRSSATPAKGERQRDERPRNARDAARVEPARNARLDLPEG